MLQGARGWDHFVRRPECIRHDLLDLRENVRSKVNLEVAMLLVEVVLVFREGKLVARLVSAVFVALFLDSIVCQMDQSIAQIVVYKRTWRCPQVSIVVSKTFELAVDECEHTEAPDVEFSLVVKGRFLNVLLHNERFLLVIIALTQDTFDLSERGAHCDPVAPIWILTRFHDPDVIRDYLRRGLNCLLLFLTVEVMLLLVLGCGA